MQREKAMIAAKLLLERHGIRLNANVTEKIQGVFQKMQTEINTNGSHKITDKVLGKELGMTQKHLAPLEQLKELIGRVFQKQSQESQGST